MISALLARRGAGAFGGAVRSSAGPAATSVRTLFGGGDVDVDALQEALNDQATVLIDVREQAESRAGPVEGAINIPLSGFSLEALSDAMGVTTLAELRTKKIALFCKAGVRSRMVVHALEEHGINSVNAVNPRTIQLLRTPQ